MDESIDGSMEGWIPEWMHRRMVLSRDHPVGTTGVMGGLQAPRGVCLIPERGLGGAGVAARAVSGNSIRLFCVHLSWGQGSSSAPNPGTRTWLSQLIPSQVLDPDPILASSSVLQSPRVRPFCQDVQQVWEHPEQPLPRFPPKRTGQGLDSEPGSCGEFQVGFWPCRSIISAASWLPSSPDKPGCILTPLRDSSLSWPFSGS